MNKKEVTRWQIFLFFAKTGCITFGGGWSIVAQMQDKLVEKWAWITQEDLMNFITVGKSLPGIMICNISYLCGYHLRGLGGALAAIVGIAVAPFVILCALTYFYTALQGNQLVEKAVAGVRAAVVPIIGFTLARMQKGTINKFYDLAIMLGCTALATFTSLSNLWMIGAAAIIGILIGRIANASR